MYVLIGLLVLSVVIRRYIPDKGFLCDDRISALTYFGEARKYELRNISECGPEAYIVMRDPEPVVERVMKQPAQDNSGIDLSDINAKTQDEVDMSNLYGNLDDSDEDLSSMMDKVLK